ncbi:MAG: tetratricopeptide repeat protein [Patescibacteria group bacterium]|nr:tetratricopeptide repeat protein [Patescibacteria group bacterium]
MYPSLSWARNALFAGLVLALVISIPAAWFPLQLGKVAMFAVLLFAGAVFFLVSGGAREYLRTHGWRVALLVGLLPLAYLLSWAFSIDKAVSFAGPGVEADTVVFVCVAFAAFILSMTLARTLRTAQLLLNVLFWALIAAALFQIAAIMFGPSIPFLSLTDRSENLVGKWNDLGILISMLWLFVLARLESGSLTRRARTFNWVLVVLIALLLAFINFPVAWGFVLASGIVIGSLALLRRRAEGGSTMPVASAVAVLFAIVFLIFGSVLNTSLTKLFPVSSLEVRPSFSTSLSTINAAHGGSLGRLWVGTGPDTFGMEWLKFRPAEVLQSLFWNLDFNVGFSTLVTALGTVGLIGVIAWLIPAVLVLAALVRAARLSVLSREERIVTTMLVLSSLTMLVSLALYVPSQNIVLLYFVLSGCAFGFLWRQGRSAEDDPTPRRFIAIKALVLWVLILGLTGMGAFVMGRRVIALSIANEGTLALSQGDVDGALALAAKAQAIERTSNTVRPSADAGLVKLQSIAAQANPGPDVQQTFGTVAQASIAAGQAAVMLDPGDYRALYSLGNIYALLAGLGVQGAYTSATQAYQATLALNPTNPAVYLSIARLEDAQKNGIARDQAIAQALKLKPNYTDAILAVVQLDAARGDLQGAIRDTTTAVQTAPGVASIWFELGALYYTGGDYKDAGAALTQALSLQSDYANAKYYLGLSYWALGDGVHAKALFDDLAKSNPDNVSVQTIQGYLTAGKTFAQVATSTQVKSQSPAPVSQ